MNFNLVEIPTPDQAEEKFATAADGIELCRKLKPVLEIIGLYPALTGGVLYKDGRRKDIDIVIYRNRQEVRSFELNDKNVELALNATGVEITEYFGFVTKAKWNGFTVDIFNPETVVDMGEGYGE